MHGSQGAGPPHLCQAGTELDIEVVARLAGLAIAVCDHALPERHAVAVVISELDVVMRGLELRGARGGKVRRTVRRKAQSIHMVESHDGCTPSSRSDAHEGSSKARGDHFFHSHRTDRSSLLG